MTRTLVSVALLGAAITLPAWIDPAAILNAVTLASALLVGLAIVKADIERLIK